MLTLRLVQSELSAGDKSLGTDCGGNIELMKVGLGCNCPGLLSHANIEALRGNLC